MKGEYRTAFFGERWDAPILDHAVQVQTPVGTPCVQCGEPVADGDRGTLISTVRLDADSQYVPGLEPMHLECGVRAVVGSVKHLEGQCMCHGRDELSEDDRSFRQQGRDVMAWLAAHGS